MRASGEVRVRKDSRPFEGGSMPADARFAAGGLKKKRKELCVMCIPGVRRDAAVLLLPLLRAVHRQCGERGVDAGRPAGCMHEVTAGNGRKRAALGFWCIPCDKYLDALCPLPHSLLNHPPAGRFWHL